MRDRLGEFELGDSVLLSAAEVELQLLIVAAGDQRGDGDQAAVARARLRPVPALELQRCDPTTAYVFPSVAGKLRDTSSTEADWRANRVRLGYPTFTSHGLRKTCATALDVAGVSARGITE